MIRLPNITADSQRQQLVQIKDYLYQFAQELNLALEQLPAATQGKSSPTPTKNQAMQAQEQFNQLRTLIIKSADIVNAYYETIEKKLSGSYVAQSDFGTFREETEASLQANAKGVSLLFDNQQTLQSHQQALETVVQSDASCTTILGADAWCKIGVLSETTGGFPVYGMEIGQKNSLNGQTVYQKFAQYRSDGIHLFDQNGIEVATVSDLKLQITQAQIANAAVTDSLALGGYQMSFENGLTLRWAKA